MRAIAMLVVGVVLGVVGDRFVHAPRMPDPTRAEVAASATTASPEAAAKQLESKDPAVHAEASPVAQRVEGGSTADAPADEATRLDRIQQTERQLEIALHWGSHYYGECSRLGSENSYLRTELGAHFKQSIASRAVFADLSDPDGVFSLSELQYAITNFVVDHPIDLSDGEARLVAPVAAAYESGMGLIRGEVQEYDDDPAHTKEEKREFSFNAIVRRHELAVELRRKLVPILGAERVALHFEDYEDEEEPSPSR